MSVQSIGLILVGILDFDLAILHFLSTEYRTRPGIIGFNLLQACTLFALPKMIVSRGNRDVCVPTLCKFETIGAVGVYIRNMIEIASALVKGRKQFFVLCAPLAQLVPYRYQLFCNIR